MLNHQQLSQSLRDPPQMFKDVNICSFKRIMDKAIPIYALRAKTEKLLWHQCLGHPCDKYLYNAEDKFIDGVPKFDCKRPELFKCPTCIQAKETKVPDHILLV